MFWPSSPPYAPQGVRATAIPTGTRPQVTTTNRRGIAKERTHLVPRPAEPVGQRPGRTRGGLPGLRDRAPPLLNNNRRPPSCSTVEAKRGAGIESEKRACQFCSNRVKWEPRGTENNAAGPKCCEHLRPYAGEDATHTTEIPYHSAIITFLSVFWQEGFGGCVAV